MKKNPAGLVLKAGCCITLYYLLAGCHLSVFSDQTKASQPEFPQCLDVVYFIPEGQYPNRGYTERIDTLIATATHFFDRWMEHWGYDERLRVAPGITVVRGKEDLQYYIRHGSNAIRQEVDDHLAAKIGGDSRTALIFTCVNGDDLRGVPFSATGTFAFVADAPFARERHPAQDTLRRSTAEDHTADVLHELGHAMGLRHNWGNGSDNNQYGYTLMGPDDNYPIAKTYLSESDCAILSLSPVFVENTPSAGTANITAIDIRDAGKAAVISGKLLVQGDSVSSILFYNDCLVDGAGANKDYDATSWKGRIIEGDSFSVTMPYSDFRHNYDTTYQLNVAVCLSGSGVRWFTYNYAMKDGIVHNGIAHPRRSFLYGYMFPLLFASAMCLLFIQHKKRK